MDRLVCSSTVVGRAYLVIGLVLAAAVVTFADLTGHAPVWALALIAAVCVVTAVHLSTVRMTADREWIVLAQGPWGRIGRTIPTSVVIGAASVDLSWPQVFGVGAPVRWRTTRLTVRPGPTLRVDLDNREMVRISTADPVAALKAINIKPTEEG